ncbi:hypothetical protein O6H91_02G018300 [Diphasiastrum complanatum]|uniref:Uncharacterized protein n=1 Tax=Diphasiastrum complanatum TaxID=34168 RepID=A0ACC2ED89_DIPCM|nr:hypothetical protein O6H91_02G018300 [Diphasiastrum complanatum]
MGLSVAYSSSAVVLLLAVATIVLLLVFEDESSQLSRTLVDYFPSSSSPSSSSAFVQHQTDGESSQLESDLVDLTLVEGAAEKDAVCLDGSLPAYHLRRGFGSGKRNWLIHMEGGGWCSSDLSCAQRSQTSLGSSKHMARQILFSGILSMSPSLNPDFYNWNQVKIRYCDGASFSGDVDSDLAQHIHYRGQKLWQAVIGDLLHRGLADADKALLSGCSAGGLAAILHCDKFQKFLPKKATVKCLSDAGYFLDVQDISGNYSFRSFYEKVIKLQNVQANFPESCDSKDDVTKCFFPEYLVKDIQTPLFILNPAYDVWQLQNIWIPDSADISKAWNLCKNDPIHCSEGQIEILQGYRKKLIERLKIVQQKDLWGLFINSCFLHCQSEVDTAWNGLHAPRVNNQTIAETVGEWFFERKIAQEVDCAYPCNPTCPPWNGWRRKMLK